MTTTERDDERATTRRTGMRGDYLAAGAAVTLVALASGIGWYLISIDVPILVFWPPLLAIWEPRVGPGTIPAILVAVAVIVWGPSYAATRPWRRVLAVAWLATLAWTMSLALIDGFSRGFALRLTTLTEYLHEVPRIVEMGVPQFLTIFADLVPNDVPGFWTTHVAGHPPLATLIYVWLDQLGLGGGAIASTVTVLVGTTFVIALAVTLRTLGAERAARTFLPFAVLFPGAIWVGVSADGLFVGVFAWGVALTALAAHPSRRGASSAALAFGAGVLLGASLFLNYGLSVAMLIPIAIVVLTRAWRVIAPVCVAAGGLTAVFWAYGFWWFDGYFALLLRYGQPGEFGGLRPYSYFVWANLAAQVFVIGLAVVVGMRRAVSERDPGSREWVVLAVLAGAALTAVLLANLSGLSKAETERIWMPFVVWLLPLTALLPPGRVRTWLTAQAVLALTVNHLLDTFW